MEEPDDIINNVTAEIIDQGVVQPINDSADIIE